MGGEDGEEFERMIDKEERRVRDQEVRDVRCEKRVKEVIFS